MPYTMRNMQLMQCNMSNATYATNVMKHEHTKYHAMRPIMQTTWKYDEYAILQCNLDMETHKVIEACNNDTNHKDTTTCNAIGIQQYTNA